MSEPLDSVSSAQQLTTPLREDDRPTATNSPAARPPGLPDRIGHYSIRRVIGGGGMGVVYEAVQEQPRRFVALKVMKAGITSAGALRRFEYESQALAQLHHPGIVQVYESGTAPQPGDPAISVPYFAMEYIANARTLTQHVIAQQLSVTQRLELFIGICEALAHGHLHGIIHRDLKPENILIGADGQPKIIDFGVARAVDVNGSSASLQTEVGQLIGTIQYMSPEQIDADPRQLDQRCDIYAMGVILYELLCDRLPYPVSKSDMLGAAKTIKEGKPRRPSTVYRFLRGDLEAIVLKALEKDPRDRYQTAEELGRDIRQYLLDEPLITARRPTARYILAARTRSLLRKQPVTLALALIVVVTGIFTESIGVKSIYEWTKANRIFYGWLTTHFSPTAGREHLEHVALIHMNDETVSKMPELAEKFNLMDLDPTFVRSWRRLHGRLMKHLAQSGARVVAFDIGFKASGTGIEPPYNEDFVRGISALRDKGIPTIVTAEWEPDDAGRPTVSPDFLPMVRWGGATIEIPTHGLWQLELFYRIGWRPAMPSFALATVAAALNPDYQPEFAIQEEPLTVQLSGYSESIPGEVGFKNPMPWEREVSFPFSAIDTAVQELVNDKEEIVGHRQVHIGFYFIDMPSADAEQRSILPLHEVLEMNEEVLQHHFAGKVVVVGDARNNSTDWFEFSGRPVHGSVGHAAAIDQLLRNAPIFLERTALGRMIVTLAAVIGLIIGSAASRRALLRVIVLAVSAMLMLIASIAAYVELHYLINPLLAILAMVIASELSVVLRHIRRGTQARSLSTTTQGSRTVRPMTR